MKKLFSILCLVLTTFAMSAKPILVGHRGSIYGVENTVESFTNGAKLGYEYLETDIKITKDGQYVCSHNDDLTAVGGTLTIATSTLAELQAEDLKQTRGGVAYTGHLCSLAEYLDVCKEYNVKPLMELKWTDQISSNNTSGIPDLIKFIEDRGFRKSCIIITSMKPCLEYIRTNYPDIELQFLTGEKWANHFDWCVQYGIDANIQAGYFDKSTVTKYHDKGLKVNMWTTNDAAGYKTYGNMGCDFITTDKLDPKDLPDLDASVTFPPNTTDYPNLEGNVKGSYTATEVQRLPFPSALTDRTIRHALLRDNKWVVLSVDSNNSPAINVIDAATGEVSASYSMEGIDKLGDIAFSADGVLLASSINTVPFNGGGDSWKLYKWADTSSAPEVVVTADDALYLGNWVKSLAGERMCVSGRMSDLKVYVSTASATASTKVYRIAGINVKNGAIESYCYAMDNNSYTAAKWGDLFTMTITPFSQSNILINSTSCDPKEYTFNWDGTRIPMDEYATFADGFIPTAVDGVSFHRRASKVYGLIPTCDENGGSYGARLCDVTDGIGSAAPVADALDVNLGADVPVYATTAIENYDSKTYLHVFVANKGMVTYEIDTEAATVEPITDLNLKLERQWIRSSVDNTEPEHIDGSNAQQGTAVNGLFYINDCSDKLIYVFDKTGCIGSIPGGAGWGCARDDAGNIIVRNDKNKDANFTFIAYPAGARPDSYGEAVSFSVEAPLDGETHFINASGDILGGIGHIYLFPNGQNGVNIVTVTNGKVTKVAKYTDLKLTGSTAGYVIPINDDTENWIYQVRASGLYFYNGGVNTDLSTARATTTAPGRNSTGGGAYFTLGGNNILVHNSGANYKGGFTVRNMTTDEVITSVDPIGQYGYNSTPPGNYSTFNWIIAEKNSDTDYTLYQYCPANGIAVYRLYNQESGVEDILGEAAQDAAAPSLTLAGDILTAVNADAVKSISVYTIAGQLVATTHADTLDVSALAPGTYIALLNNASPLKFIKR
jgi:glycerophosphoryl diester phosphodiesterase